MKDKKTSEQNENIVSDEHSFFDNLTWLSVKDAAIYLRKFRKDNGKPSEGAIRTAIWRGVIKARKWQRRIYIKKSDLDRMLQYSSIIGGKVWG